MGNTTTINTLAETRTIETVCVPLVAGIANRTENFAGSHQNVKNRIYFVRKQESSHKEREVCKAEQGERQRGQQAPVEVECVDLSRRKQVEENIAS